jgi:hypothetical protein
VRGQVTARVTVSFLGRSYSKPLIQAQRRILDRIREFVAGRVTLKPATPSSSARASFCSAKVTSIAVGGAVLLW